jgi:7-cyano-7-deazaguanine synthase
MKIVVLASGGIDSALMMYLFKKEGHEVLPLHINYNQLAENHEWESCKALCDFFSLEPFKMDITGFGKLPSGLTNSDLDVYKDAFLPTRNLTFITLASAYAYSKSTNMVAIGLLANPIFPDQTKEFIQKAQISISESLGKPIKILTPLIDLDKRDVLKLAIEYNIPKITYFCHSGTDVPCGRCVSCKERFAAESALNSKNQT